MLAYYSQEAAERSIRYHLGWLPKKARPVLPGHVSSTDFTRWELILQACLRCIENRQGYSTYCGSAISTTRHGTFYFLVNEGQAFCLDQLCLDKFRKIVTNQFHHRSTPLTNPSKATFINMAPAKSTLLATLMVILALSANATGDYSWYPGVRIQLPLGQPVLTIDAFAERKGYEPW